jgi:membrane protease YdiL (CAAX protease family)
MSWMRRFAAESPIAFSFFTTVLLWICYIAAGVAASLLGTTAAGQQMGSAVGRFAAALIFLGLLWRLGWLRAAGITELGSWRSWLLVLPVLVYEVLAHLYAFFGSFDLGVPESPLGRAVALNGAAAGLLEEVVYRALLLYVLTRLWADSRQGILKSVLVSSLFFGSAHLLHLTLGRPTPLVLLLFVSAFLGGIYYAAFVLHSGSVWPAVVLHVILNAVIGAQAVGNPQFAETVSGWLLVLALQLPAVVLGIVLILRVQPRPVVPAAA